ncbi:hypothetical protein [Rhodopirellula bahusiensis]|uniref:DUF4145 domain-containing protein n=1 Tax=Rhodopirellula bahusiensis TaxID=2014065 RepID=A0A2G1W893_9BACT|nr:hypothetical protein [Rhodopirellula bahusiensis]PHQ35264.1 hypothetical protein CEE69_09485 [Rhodopirellula bahusiensis]
MTDELAQTDDDIAGQWSDHFDASIKTESVRARVILSACYLDELLYQLLAVTLKPASKKDDPLFSGGNAPLGTFSSKIELAFRMGLVPSGTKSSLHFVRKIRNRFAHDLTAATFCDPQILSWTRELHALNDIARPERRASFSDGPIGDFEQSVSWLIYWIRNLIQNIPTDCPHCGNEMEHRTSLRTYPRTPILLWTK